jgi:hypothetical protein
VIEQKYARNLAGDLDIPNREALRIATTLLSAIGPCSIWQTT